MKAALKQKEYFVSHLGQHIGPWTIEEIARRLSMQQLITTDFIYDDDAADWIELNKHQVLLDFIAKEFKPKIAPPNKSASPKPAQEKAAAQIVPEQEIANLQSDASPSLSESWFIQKESHRFGPLTSVGVVKALQEKKVFDFEFIWKEGMGEWIRIAEHPEFSVENIRELVLHPKAKSVFKKREHQRITFMNEVMVHDDQALWMGQAFQGGEGGSGLIIQNATLQPGQTVKLHFASHDGLNAFNVAAEIVSKKFVRELKSVKTPVPYGVKFVGLDKKLKNTLHEYFAHKTQPGWMFAGK